MTGCGPNCCDEDIEILVLKDCIKISFTYGVTVEHIYKTIRDATKDCEYKPHGTFFVNDIDRGQLLVTLPKLKAKEKRRKKRLGEEA